MNLYMNHVTEEMIRKEREEILNAGQEEIRALADVVAAMLAADQLCVIGSEEKIEDKKHYSAKSEHCFKTKEKTG